MIVRVPPDTVNIFDGTQLTYLHYNGSEWTVRDQFEGDGWFDPSAALAVSRTKTHLLWVGIPASKKMEWRERAVISSDLYYCLYQQGRCSEPVSLNAADNDVRRVDFRNAVIDQNGLVHLILDIWGVNYHYILDEQGQIRENQVVGYFTEAKLKVHNDTLHMVYMDAPERGQGANDLFYKYYADGTWSERVRTYHDIDQQGNHPVLEIDNEGIYHQVFTAKSREGLVSTMYNFSADRGRTWSEPETITTHPHLGNANYLAVDRYGVLHAAWSNIGQIRFDDTADINSYYASRRNGVWSEAIELFPELEAQYRVQMAVSNDGVVHVVLFGIDDRLHHMRFE